MPENSWATGTNPEVESLYLRELELNPALTEHNLAQSGSDVDDLPRQVRAALQLDPLPDLFIIQSVDNDIRCDGTDDDNYASFGSSMNEVLASINAGAPNARILVVGLWATVQNFSDVTAGFPNAVVQNQGGGLCDVFDETGQEIPAAIATLQGIVDAYQEQLRASCAAVSACTFGGDEVGAMVIDADDLAPDSNHLSVAGLHKMAQVVWPVLQQLT